MLVLLLIALCLASACATKVSIRGRQILVDGKPFFMKGINYNPIPVGYGRWDIDPFLSKQLVDRDIRNLKKMNVNTVRIIHVYSSNPKSKIYLLDKLYENGIYALLGFFPNGNNWEDSAFRKDCKDQTAKIVQAYKDHPATLGWLFGNEFNLPTKGNPIASFSLLKEVKDMIHTLEGPNNWHPVISTLADYQLINFVPKYSSFLDVWGIQSYRGFSFGNLFTQMTSYTTLPIIFTEYGMDSYDSIAKKEDQDTQAKAAQMLYKEIVNNKDKFCGAFIFQYADSWWKAGNPNKQDFGGWGPNAFPDKMANEEWWGVYRVTPASKKGGLDTLTARKVVDVLAKIYLPNPYSNSSSPTNSPPSAKPTKTPATKSPTKAPTKSPGK